MMDNAWFRLDIIEVEEGGEIIHRPDFKGKHADVEAYSTKKSHPDGPPEAIVRVYAKTDVLDDLADEPGVVRLDGPPVEALNAMSGQNRDKSGWSRAFEMNP